MNERDWADRFSRDVDDLLNEAGRTDAEPLSEEYRQNLDLARALTSADYSIESQMRQATRRRLLDQIDGREEWSLRKENAMRTVLRRHPAMIVTAIVLAGLLVTMLSWPGALVTAAQEIQELVQSLVLGRHTEAVQVDPELAPLPARTPPAKPTVLYDNDGWSIKTSIGNFGGNVLPDQDATVRRFDTIEQAQAILPFRLHQPGYLPAGWALREVMFAPTGGVFLFYGGPDGDIVLVSTPVYEQSEIIDRQSDGTTEKVAVRVSSSNVMVVTDKPIEMVTLNGQPAGWIEGGGLMWEADGISYRLGGANLSLDAAIHIAESLE